ncbi:MAG: UvrD-helicase domain-containing protein [Muribaculaceae bacterium]|nr:UvrD-helicase domain-containing protein [Muribaculaceae bacterium]
MENLLENLNKEQQEAVQTTKGPLLILAGAGSGKTKVLTTRIAYMIRQGVKPRNILAVTFTNKAAKEMKERIGKIIGEDMVKYMWVGTFHGICGRILRENIDKYNTATGKNLDKNFTIYDDSDTNQIITRAIKKLNLDDKVYPTKLVKSVISNAKNKMQDATAFATYARDFKSQRIAAVYEEYEKALNNNNAIDFDDMLMLTVKLLEQSAEVRQQYYDRFQHIMVDEYQDTNLAQYNLVNMLYTNLSKDIPDERSLCVVGDVDQSIYSWRGADYTIIMNFQKDYPKTKLIKLEQNYRSTAHILSAANAVIENNNERVDKVLYSNKGEGEKLSYYIADDEADEANYIVSNIRRTARGNYNQFAILYRTNNQSRALEEACMATGVPYRIYGGTKFYDRAEVKTVLCYLKLINNTDDSQSLRRVINIPKRGIGDTTMKNLSDFANSKDISLYEAIKICEESEINAKTQSKLKDFATLIQKFKDAQNSYTLKDFVTLVIEKSGYLAELQSKAAADPEFQDDINNLQELVNVAEEFVPEENDNILGEFLQQVALVSDLDSMENEANNVTLMTLHAAKGLEFPTVFIAGMDEGIFPSQRTLQNASEVEEERRLMYVGVTRAEEKLYLVSAKRRQTWGEYRYYNPSRFIEEIPQNLIESSESMGTSTSSRSSSTFRSAVSKAKAQSDSDGYVKPSSGFGANFVAPQRRGLASSSSSSGSKSSSYSNSSYNRSSYQKPQSNRTPQRTILVKSAINKKREQEKIDAFFKDNAIKRLAEERRKQQEAQRLEAEQKERERNQSPLLDDIYSVGQRVFHEHMGVGHITDVMTIGESVMYTIDFGKLGKKAMDASYAKLKKF